MPTTDNLVSKLSDLIREAPRATLDTLSRDVWIAHAGGMLSDTDAQALAEAIQNHRSSSGQTRGVTAGDTASQPSLVVVENASVASGSAPAKPPRSWSYFPAKRPQRSPDKAKSLERRRTLAATGPMPPALACKFTTGELAVLKVVADEVSAKGTCVLSIPEIAARAGVGQTKARMALRIAATLGLVLVSERRVAYRPNLTNVVRIISREWNAWLAKRKPRTPAALPKSPTDQGTKDLQSSASTPMGRGEGSLLRRPRNQGFMGIRGTS